MIAVCVNKSKDLNKKSKRTLLSASTPKALIERMKKRGYFVYETKGKIAGIGALDKNEVRTMYTLPEFRNKNIGSKILKRIEKEEKKRRIKKLFYILLKEHPNSI